MPKKFTASETQLKPDPRYQDKVVAKFINCMMSGGRKGPATRVVYRAFDEIQVRLDKDKNYQILTDLITKLSKPEQAQAYEEFADTLSLVREVRFDDAFTFKFSMREGTPATRMPAEWIIPDAVIDARYEALLATVRGISRERNLGRLGERMEVLVEKEARKGELLQCRSRDFKTVLVQGPTEWIGRYLTVELTGTTGATFTGTLVQERQPLPMAG